MSRHPVFQSRSLHRKICSLIVLAVFSMTLVLPPAYAQVALSPTLNLPMPGALISQGAGFQPVVMRGLRLNPNDPLRFEFIIDAGDERLNTNELKFESNRLIKYFLATLTVPEKELWVNLSPYEKDRIISPEFGLTEMGRDMLAQDYILKQLTSSMMYPEEEIGARFWERVYAKAQQLYGTTDIPLNTFNKVWIIPDGADVYHNGPTVFLLNSRLKVMLQEDYLALEHIQSSEQFEGLRRELINEAQNGEKTDPMTTAIVLGLCTKIIFCSLPSSKGSFLDLPINSRALNPLINAIIS